MSGSLDRSQGIFTVKLIVCFRSFLLPLRSDHKDSRGNVSPKNHVILTWIFREMILESLELSGNFIP